MKTSKTLAMGTMILILAGLGLNAENKENGSKKGKFAQLGELRAYRAKQKKLRREYRKERMEENKTFHESLKDKEPQEVLEVVITHRKTQFSETKKFMDGLYSDFVSYAKEIMAKKEMSDEKQTAFFAKLDEHHKEAVNKHNEIHSRLISALGELKNNENLTKEDIKKTFSEVLPDRKNKPTKRKRKGSKHSEE